MRCTMGAGTGLELHSGSRRLRNVRRIADEQLRLLGLHQLLGRRRPKIRLSESRPLIDAEQQGVLLGDSLRVAVDVESEQGRVAVAAEEVEAHESASRREL